MDRKNEFKYILSYEKSDKSYGNGEGIHVTVRSDSFEEAYNELRGEVMTKMVSLIGEGDKIKQEANKTDLDEANRAFAIAAQEQKDGPNPAPIDEKKLKPEILMHPNLPKPMHGLNPRTIMGKQWWDKTRKEAYDKYNQHCVACGVHKTQAKKHKWLEGHEFWDIDYNKGLCKVVSIEPLCHYCHNFIHTGRLTAIVGIQKSKKEVRDILEHGFKILSDNNLQCFSVTLELAEKLGANTYGVTAYPNPKSKVKWEDWRMELEGKKYKPVHKNYEAWEKYYQQLNN